ncbi:hypothetical protein C5S36_03870, partial [Candidatus Methanophagaceae archaeon]
MANSIFVLFTLLDSVIQFFAVYLGYGIRGLVIGRLITSVILCIATIVLTRILVPGISYNPFVGNVHLIKKMLGYGLNSQAAVGFSTVNRT